jgi:hypothetical protein
VVDKVALEQVFSEYFGFPCQSSFHQLLHNHHRSSGAGTIGQQCPTYQVDSVSPHPEKLKEKPVSHYICKFIQSVPAGKISILGGHSMGHSKKKVYMDMCPILVTSQTIDVSNAISYRTFRYALACKSGK